MRVMLVDVEDMVDLFGLHSQPVAEGYAFDAFDASSADGFDMLANTDVTAYTTDYFSTNEYGRDSNYN